MRNEKIYSSWNNIYICDNAKEELLYGILCEMDNMKKVKKISFRVVLSYGFVFFIITLFTFSIIIIKNNNTNENNVLISEAEYHDVININIISELESLESGNILIKQDYIDTKYAKEFQNIGYMDLKLNYIMVTYKPDPEKFVWGMKNIPFTEFDCFSLGYRNNDKSVRIDITDGQKKGAYESRFFQRQKDLEDGLIDSTYFGEPYNYKKSTINNIEILIFKDKIEHIAIFNQNDCHYYIKSDNFSDIEFVDLIKNIINEDFSQCNAYLKDLI